MSVTDLQMFSNNLVQMKGMRFKNSMSSTAASGVARLGLTKLSIY